MILYSHANKSHFLNKGLHLALVREMAYAILGLQPRDQAAMLANKATDLFQKYHNALRCLQTFA